MRWSFALSGISGTGRPRLEGQTVIAEHFDHALTLTTAADTYLRIETPFSTTRADGSAQLWTPGSVAEGWHDDLGFVGLTIIRSEIDETGALRLGLADQTWLRAGPDEQFEAWSLTNADGSRIICSPGGELVTFS